MKKGYIMIGIIFMIVGLMWCLPSVWSAHYLVVILTGILALIGLFLFAAGLEV